MPRRSAKTRDVFDGGFNDLASFREEMGADAAGIDDRQAMQIVAESLGEKAKLTPAQRAHLDKQDPETYHDSLQQDVAQAIKDQARVDERMFAEEKRRMQNDLERERRERNELQHAQRRLADDLENEKMKRLYGDRFVWRSPGSLDDYLAKERLKREVKEELLDEKKRLAREKELANLWATPRAKSPKKKKAKSPRKKSKSPAKKKK